MLAWAAAGDRNAGQARTGDWPCIVLGKLAQQQWRTLAEPEQDAFDGYLDAVWRSSPARYPSRVGAFPDAAVLLDSAGATGCRGTAWSAEPRTGECAELSSSAGGAAPSREQAPRVAQKMEGISIFVDCWYSG
jgi:hypothetical protein